MMAQAGGKPGILWFSFIILCLMRRLRPLSYRAFITLLWNILVLLPLWKVGFKRFRLLAALTVMNYCAEISFWWGFNTEVDLMPCMVAGRRFKSSCVLCSFYLLSNQWLNKSLMDVKCDWCSLKYKWMLSCTALGQSKLSASRILGPPRKKQELRLTVPLITA